MKPERNWRSMMCLLLMSSLMLLNSCEKLETTDNLTGTVVTVSSINGGEVLESDVLTGGYTQDDVVTVTFNSQARTLPFENLPSELDNTSALDTVVFSQYHVAHSRDDGGLTPEDFTAAVHVQILPATSDATVKIIVVRAFDKNQSPLQELRDRGQLITTATITFYGEDGYGNDITAACALQVSFGNFQDES